jgi:carbon storage regulator
MLVLSRRAGEAIVIGGGIVVEVVEIRGGRVRLSIHAPREVSVDREEVWEQKQRSRVNRFVAAMV